MKLNKIIIWGFKLHNHTHSYIHNAFYKTFKYLGYEVYWFNKEGNNNYLDKGNPLNFENCLYIVVGCESEYLPINQTSYYIWHTFSCPIYKEFEGDKYLIPLNSKYKNNSIPIEHLVKLHTLWNPCNCDNCNDKDNGCNLWSKNSWINKKNMYENKNYYYNLDNNIIYIYWATDLLPYEIDENIKKLESFEIKNISNFIGMSLEHWNDFKNELKKNGIEYNNYGGTFNENSEKNKSIEENMKLIQESILAPALQDNHQINHQYIPCRIFKNISYGKMGITNNSAVNELFNNKLIYSDNIQDLVKKGLEFENIYDKYDKIKELMIEVRDNHTYINRINFILDFLKKFKNIEVIK